MDLGVVTKDPDNKPWGTDAKGYSRIYAIGDCNYGCVPKGQTPKTIDQWPIPPIPKISYPGEEQAIIACANIHHTDKLCYQNIQYSNFGSPLKIHDMHWPWGAGMFATSLGPDDACFVAGANWQKNSGIMCTG